jgi:hypothetical protein
MPDTPERDARIEDLRREYDFQRDLQVGFDGETIAQMRARRDAAFADLRAEIERPYVMDIGAWMNVIMAAESMEEEVEEREKDGDETVRVLRVFARLLRGAINTCRWCGSTGNAPHSRDCRALSSDAPPSPRAKEEVRRLVRDPDYIRALYEQNPAIFVEDFTPEPAPQPLEEPQ